MAVVLFLGFFLRKKEGCFEFCHQTPGRMTCTVDNVMALQLEKSISVLV